MFAPLLLALVAFQAAAGNDYGISAGQAHAMVMDPDKEVFFIDVRDPVEIMFIGWAEGVHANIPFLLVDRYGWNEDSGSFPLPRNPDFAAEVEAALIERGLDRETTIITMCRSGSARGEPSASYLRQAGFPQVLYVRHGFQGDRIAEGEHAGMRLKNGWQNEGLPWSPRMDGDKVYRPGR
ncbi:MAG: sulfurtransferase [Wenzhouxiangella sp.]|nr:MAG: sulfurtransferase [Wenzhouxiangella sp.]